MSKYYPARAFEIESLIKSAAFSAIANTGAAYTR